MVGTRLKKHRELHPHHIYQLEVIFLYAAGFFLLFPYLALVFEYNLEPLRWQWYFFWPWMGLYTWYTLKQRSNIPASEKIEPMKRPIVHWVLLGIAVALLHFQESIVTDLKSIEISFVIFSLFLADGYWDFRKDTDNG